MRTALLKLGLRTTDTDYQKRYNGASGLAEKGRVLMEYAGQYPERFSKSPWVKTALAVAPHIQVSPSAKNRKSVPWYASSPDIGKRRQIVLNNPSLSAAQLCGVFDSHRIPLPPTWERQFDSPTWVKAYKDKGARGRIHRIISTDRKQN